MSWFKVDDKLHDHRKARKAGKVRDVETLPCPGRDGPHWLRNSAQRGGLVTACIGCGLSWSELDEMERNRT